MKKSTTTNPYLLSEYLTRFFVGVFLILVMAVSVFSLLALLGFDPKDSGWSHMGYQPQITNWVGPAGAWVADFMLSMMGVSAWLVPPILFYPSVKYLIKAKAEALDSVPMLMLHTCGVIILLITLSCLASLHWSNTELIYPFTSGGLLGQAISDWMVSWFSLLGSSVLLIAAALIGLTFYLDVTWDVILESLGGVVLSIYRKGSNLEVNPVKKQTDTDGFYTDADEHKSQINSLKESIRQRFDSTTETSTLHESEEVRIDEVSISDNSDQVAERNVQRETDAKDSSLHSVSTEKGVKIEPTFSEQFDVEENTPPTQQSIPVIDPLFAAKPEITESEQFSHSDAMDYRDTLNEVPVLNEVVQPEILSDQPETTEVNHTKEHQVSKRELKIVPLAEAHQPMQSDDLDAKVAPERRPARSLRKIPSMELLDPPELQTDQGYSDEQLEDMSRLLETKLKDFGVVAEVVEVNPGPVITRFEIQPAPGVKASKITNLAKDLARSMAVVGVRVVEVIPGKSVMGIEVPNASRQTVRLSEVLNSKPYKEAPSKLTLGLGNDIAGNPVVTNLAKMPHLLVAGTTGSGKSVGVNAMLLSLLFKATPDEVRLMMVDPKMLELSIYEGIPHLLTPVITDMKEAAGGLRWCVGEMERRYRLMAKMGVRNIAGFNDKVKEAEQKGQPLLDPLWNPEEYGEPEGTPAPPLETLPYIVVVIDEFADMMMIVGKKVEELIARIAQKARAAGIHLILATQRPSVDVITGLIKANVPTRIAFQVSSKIDSRTILDQAGAENLLGYGDMLFLPAGTSVPNRVHGAFVSDDEVHRVVEAWKLLGSPDYIENIFDDGSAEPGMSGSGSLFDDEQDPLYDEAVAFVTETRKVSISSVQRKLKIGYNRAARMVEAMESAGVVSTAGSNGQREVLAPPPVKG